MNEVLNTIRNRRSVRTYLPTQIKQEDLDLIIESGIYAPSGHNDQPWHFTVIQNREIIQHISDRSKELMVKSQIDWVKNMGLNPKINLTYNAPTLIIVSGNKIEAIISNNDAMAIGAIKSLQKYGYNLGNNSKYIPVVGIDALPEAQELIKQGLMTGTVIQDPHEHANAIYTIGMNLVTGNNSLSGTNYKFDETGITVKLPYYEYVK